MFFAFVILTLAFTTREVSDVKCNRIEVLYDGHQTISLGEDEILRMVKNADSKVLGQDMNRINAEQIEAEIEKNVAVEKAEVYKTIARDTSGYKGVLAVKVQYRVPVLRVMTGNDDYFLDKNGVRIPVSEEYSARVLVVTGTLDSDFAGKNLLPFVLFLEKNDFWKAQIEQIEVLSDQELILTPLVGSHAIELGTLENFREKMDHLRTFYEDVLAQNNWNKYKSINLKFKNQIIGTKK